MTQTDCHKMMKKWEKQDAHEMKRWIRRGRKGRFGKFGRGSPEYQFKRE